MAATETSRSQRYEVPENLCRRIPESGEQPHPRFEVESSGIHLRLKVRIEQASSASALRSTHGSNFTSCLIRNSLGTEKRRIGQVGRSVIRRESENDFIRHDFVWMTEPIVGLDAVRADQGRRGVEGGRSVSA